MEPPPGGGVRVGTFLHPRWSLELAVDAAARRPARSRIRLRSASEPLIDAQAAGAFDQQQLSDGQHGRRFSSRKDGTRAPWLPRRNGVGQGHVRIDISDFLVHSDRAPLHDGAVSSIPGLGSLTQAGSHHHGSETLRRTDNSVGGVLGLEAAIDLSDHFALVPGVRAIVFSSEGQSVFLIRPEAGVRWNF